VCAFFSLLVDAVTVKSGRGGSGLVNVTLSSVTVIGVTDVKMFS